MMLSTRLTRVVTGDLVRQALGGVMPSNIFRFIELHSIATST